MVGLNTPEKEEKTFPSSSYIKGLIKKKYMKGKQNAFGLFFFLKKIKQKREKNNRKEQT